MMQSTYTCDCPVPVSTLLCSFPKGRQVVSNNHHSFHPTKPQDSAGSGCYRAFSRPKGSALQAQTDGSEPGTHGAQGRMLVPRWVGILPLPQPALPLLCFLKTPWKPFREAGGRRTTLMPQFTHPGIKTPGIVLT